MKKPKITEGEWNVDTFSDGSVLIISDYEDGFCDEVATINTSIIDANGNNNAKAISAVPEMIDALMDAYLTMVRLKWHHPNLVSDDLLIKMEKVLLRAGVTYEFELKDDE